ncbi:MAG TPA: cytochrome-c oxidase, cbb3-type subunit III [Candidatus Azosocius sp. HAIN]
MNNFWHLYVGFFVFINILIYGLILYFSNNIKKDDFHHKVDLNSVKYSEYHYDEIEELNEPLPKWWYWMFFISIFYGIIYLIFYPGFGNFSGILNWSSSSECRLQIEKHKKVYNDLYKSYKNISIEDLSNNNDALKIGRNIFLNNCSPCHGYDAKGSKGFPNLTNSIWLYGGSSKDIIETITNGRNGIMPALGQIIGNDEDIKCVALYIQSLSIKNNCDSNFLIKGKEIYQKICFICHGIDASGDKIKGAPSLMKPQWVYGSSLEDIISTIKYGRSGVMPSHKDILSEDQIHIVTSYIYSLNDK